MQAQVYRKESPIAYILWNTNLFKPIKFIQNIYYI